MIIEINHSPSVECMRSILQHNTHIAGISKSDETEASGPARLGVLHHHAVDDLAIPLEVPAEVVLRCLPRQSADKQLSTSDTESKFN